MANSIKSLYDNEPVYGIYGSKIDKGGSLFKKCLITGASGFIGSALKVELIKRGGKVIALPRHLLFKPKILKKFVTDHNPDLIFHLATFGNRHFQKNEKKIVKANINGTFNLLEACKDLNFSAFINTGSSSEYGIKLQPMREEDSLDSETFYGITKASATFLCRAFAHYYNKPIVTVRPFSVYGLGEPEDKFIPTTIKCAKTNQILNLALGVHDWIYIEDYINGVLKVVEYAKKLQGKAINIGTGVQTTNEEVVKIVEKVIGVKMHIKRIKTIREYDTNISWVADNSFLKSLGWMYKYDLSKGITKLVYG